MEALGLTARVPAEVMDGFLAALGCELSTPVEDFAFIPQEDVEQALVSFEVGGYLASALHRGQATRLVARAHAVCAGPRTIAEILVPTPPQPPSAAFPPSPAQPPPVSLPKRKFAEILDQGDDQVYEELPPGKIADLRAAHVLLCGGASPRRRPTDFGAVVCHQREA